jgi:UDP-N-acetylglucosamine acyltransferase
MAQIHPSAIVEKSVQLADDVTIGAYCTLRGDVEIGPGTFVDDHSQIRGHTVIGRKCRIGPGAYVGLDPQHLKYAGEKTSLIVGDEVVIRELASVHRSSHQGLDHATRVGNRCFLMGGTHVAHDCVLGDDIIMANDALLGGHVTVGARAFLGGGSVVHQFCRLGRISMIAGNEAVSHDLPPFSVMRYGGLKGYNAIGCRRGGLSQEAIFAIRRAFRVLHTHRTLPIVIEAIKSHGPLTDEVRELIDFLTTTKRGIIPSLAMFRPGGGSARDDGDDE